MLVIYSVGNGLTVIAKLLLMAGADLKLKGSEGLTALELANKKPNTNVAQCLRRVTEITQILQPLGN